MILFKNILVLCLCITSLSIQASPLELQKKFIDLMVDKYQFDRKVVESTLQKAIKNEAILQSIAKPWEAKPWHQYYPIFLTEKRLIKGLAFWQTHKSTLARAEQETGVPAEIIVAIIGVETFYGAYLGKYSVLDA
ncbi:MAG: lytic murein transglycosylase, partial [Sinobacterium sp.]